MICSCWIWANLFVLRRFGYFNGWFKWFFCEDDDDPSGEINIVYTGLRPGEKLYEELLINAESLPTSHPLIFKAIEPSIPLSELIIHLDNMSGLLHVKTLLLP